MSKCFVFPGQGSQYVGMGDGLFEKYPEIVEIADKVLGYSIKTLCLTDPLKQLNQTQFTQPALFTVSVLSYLEKMSAGTVKVDYLAGHSLGEYTALFAAGAFDFETGLRIVRRRGELMSQAPKGAMAAVLGLGFVQVKSLLDCSPFQQVEMANINTNDQIVLSGDYEEVFAAQSLFEEAGARYITLKVSAGFHSRIMDQVAEDFDLFLEQFEFQPLTLPVVSNLTGRLYPNKQYQSFLKGQINHSVKWYESMSWLLENGCHDIEEVGPGMVLTKMIHAIKQHPMLITDEREITENESFQKNVFMFAGQGSQYKFMGKELYTKNPIFRIHLDKAAEIFAVKLKMSLIDQLYHPRSDADFDDVRITHPAIVCFQYALAKTFIESGVHVDAVLGHSLGEYVAAVIAGVLSLDDALDIVSKQAQLLHRHTVKGRMMVILDSSDIFTSKQSLFNGVYLASKNYQKAFVVAGEQLSIQNCADYLVNAGISCQLLPVTIAFHSPLIGDVRDEFINYATQFDFHKPAIDFYSCVTQTNMVEVTPNHLWDAIAQPLDFMAFLKQLPKNELTFIDLSPSGSLALFLKYGVREETKHTFLINQYGHDAQTFSSALKMLSVQTKH